ncbi:MAG: thioredoxin family protein [Nitrospira sp.]
MEPIIVSQQQWLTARRALLVKEKQFTKLRDAMTAQIRALPWRTIDKRYSFETATGPQTLSDLFGRKTQLAVYHFMLGPDWDQGCQSCSYWADGFQGIPVHLAHRDVSFVVVSRAPLAQIEQFKTRMGWSFPWVSSCGSDFNFDFGVAFTEQEKQSGQVMYNYRLGPYVDEELPGASFFARHGHEIFHTYSTYGRGLDLLNCTYSWLDLVPKGRNEHPEHTMDWVRHHDRYEDGPHSPPSSCCNAQDHSEGLR